MAARLSVGGSYAAIVARLGSRDSVNVGHNTRAERWDSSAVAVIYHATAIYIARADGWAIPRLGGWDTVTTRSRVNALLPAGWAVYSHRDAPWLYYSGYPLLPFADGLAVDIGTADPPSGAYQPAEDARPPIIGIVAEDDGAFSSATRPLYMATARIDTLLDAAAVAAIVAAEDARRAARDARRDARLLAEHPTVRALPSSGSYADALTVRAAHHRGSRWIWPLSGCARCSAEWQLEYEARSARLAAEHRRAVAAVAAYGPRIAEWPTDALGALGAHRLHRWAADSAPSADERPHCPDWPHCPLSDHRPYGPPTAEWDAVTTAPWLIYAEDAARDRAAAILAADTATLAADPAAEDGTDGR
jgi:hypothetical protein